MTTHALTQRLTVCLSIMLGLAVFSAAPAMAQGSLASRAAQGPSVGTGPKSRAVTPQPASALPGENVGRDRVIPAEHATSDMSPTDALFDAVNRGDLAAARDAVARGADFTARNELGQTPLDESIDLSRNNITFMLLSLRGGPSDPVAPPPGSTNASSRAASALPVRPTAPNVSANAPVTVKATPSPVAVQVAPSNTNPGTPNPQRGFLGFGG